MKRLISLIFMLIAIFVLSSVTYASPIDIENQEEFGNLLTQEIGGTFIFNLSESDEQIITIDDSKIGDIISVGTRTNPRSLKIDKPLLSLHVIGNTSSSALLMSNLIIESNGGSVFAKGGSETDKYGILVTDTIAQGGGYVYARGGSGTGAHGIRLDEYTQSGGYTYAVGGIGSGAYGIYTNSYVQSGGYLYAIGGIDDDAYGVAINGNATISGTLVIDRENSARSVHVSFSTAKPNILTLKTGSTLKPVVDLSKSFTVASGLIRAVTVIESGVTLAPVVVNSYMLEKNDAISFAVVPFIFEESHIIEGSNHTGVITGTFEEIISTITMTYTASTYNPSNNGYGLKIVRTLNPEEAFKIEDAPENYINLVRNIYDILTQSTDAETYIFLIRLLDSIDNSLSVEEAIASIDDAVSLPVAIGNWRGIAKRDFNSGLISLGIKLSDLPSDSNKYWIDIPFTIGKIGDDAEMNCSVTAGYAGTLGNISYAAQLHGSYGTIENGTMLSKRLSLGILAKVEYSFNISDLFNPKAGINVGYSYGILGDDITSLNAFLVGLSVSNKFKIFDMFTIEPVIGINYIPIMSGEFTDGDYTSEKATEASLAADVKVNVGYMVSESFSIGINGFVNIDLIGGDENDFENNLQQVGEVDAVVYALNEGISRFAFGGGVNASYKLRRDMGIDASYQIYVHGKDMSHQFKVGVNLSF